MKKLKKTIEEALNEVYKHATNLLKEGEKILFYGYATQTGWKGPRRCFIALTDMRVIIIWLENKYDSIENAEDLPVVLIKRLLYSLGLSLFAPYNQKPFRPRIYIENSDGKTFAFAFDDQAIARAIFKELDGRILRFHKGN